MRGNLMSGIDAERQDKRGEACFLLYFKENSMMTIPIYIFIEPVAKLSISSLH
jgi:hypothetical protein